MSFSLYLFNIVAEKPAISTVRKDNKKDKYMKEEIKMLFFTSDLENQKNSSKKL